MSIPLVYQRWCSYQSFGDRFSKLCDRLGLNVSEDARAIVFDHLTASPEMALSEFAGNFHPSADLFNGAQRQRIYNDRVSYCSVAVKLDPCARVVIPDGAGSLFLRKALVENPAMSLEDFTERLGEFLSD